MKKLVKVLAGILAIGALSGALAGCSNIMIDDEEATEGSARSLISNTVTYSTSPEIFDLVCEGYNEGVKGPVIITKGTLKSGYSKKSVYLITLSGTDNVSKQSTGYATDLLSGFCLNNAYLENVVKIISKNIPKNSNLIFAGHSLGGMICQQVVADDTIKTNYNVLNTVCFGSPLLAAGSREGETKRLGDTSDVVPYLSGSLFNNTAWALLGLNRENGGYGTDLLGAHTKSYGRSDVWGRYDVLGKKYGSAKITLDLNTKTFYKSPSWLW